MTRVRRLQQRTHEILEATLPEDRAARVAGTAIVALIILNIAALCLETVKPVHEAAPAFFHWFEVVSVAVFSTEYVLRLWSCTASPAYAEPFRGRLRYALRPMAIVDLLSVLPFYLPTELDLRFGRVFRVFRLLKLGRYSEALRTFGRVFRARKEELVVTLTVLTILLIIASSLMYYAEKEVQPDTFSSIPASMWWAVVTLTTVGYGDIYPKTDIGRVLGGIIAICGIGMFALPTGILGSAFMEEIQALRKRFDKCPHCGKDLSA